MGARDRMGEHAEFADKYKKMAERQQAQQQTAQGELEFRNAGEDETLPGQQEVVAGSVEHQQLLKSYPTATSYAPDVNVVIKDEQPPEPPPEEPPADESGLAREDHSGREGLQRREGESDEEYNERAQRDYGFQQEDGA